MQLILRPPTLGSPKPITKPYQSDVAVPTLDSHEPAPDLHRGLVHVRNVLTVRCGSCPLDAVGQPELFDQQEISVQHHLTPRSLFA